MKTFIRTESLLSNVNHFITLLTLLLTLLLALLLTRITLARVKELAECLLSLLNSDSPDN
jgi:hypothetical protein